MCYNGIMSYPKDKEIPRLPDPKNGMNQLYESAINKLNMPYSIVSDGQPKFFASRLDYVLPRTEITTVRTFLPDIVDFLRRSREIGEILDETDRDEHKISAYVRGATAGVLVIEGAFCQEQMKNQTLTAASMISILRNEMVLPEYPSQPIDDKAEYIGEADRLASLGLNMIGSEGTSTIERLWVPRYIAEESNKQTFMKGVGISAIAGYWAYQDAYHGQDLQKLEDVIDTITDKNFDWDEALSQFINPRQSK